MVPGSDRDAETGKTDGGHDLVLEEELYLVVRRAVTDALLDVIGTLVLLGFALGLVWVGGRLALEGGSTGFVAAGGAAIVVGTLLAALTLELIPPVRHWR